MISFATRRALGIGLTTLATTIVAILSVLAQAGIGYTAHASGWILLGLIVFLALYNIRKAVPFLPLGPSSAWLQFHIYIGLVTFVVFVVHVDVSVPNGVFECVLTGAYLSVFVSGLVGLYMTRVFPARLTMLGNEVIFEQIPVIRRKLQDQIEELVVASNPRDGTSLIAEFYRSHICPFLSKHHDLATQLTRGTGTHWHRLSRAIDDQGRYLGDEERRIMDEVYVLAHRKFQLDTQYALQGALKVWLFFHIPATWALLIFAVLHSVLVHAWSGGMS